MKDRITYVDERTDPETVTAIERNGFGDPLPIHKTWSGYYVLTESLEQYRQGLRTTDPGEPHG